jgi:hypothetical protein
LFDRASDSTPNDLCLSPQVNLGPHRLMLRPRESRDLRLISSEAKVTPAGALTWAQDVFGNDVATVTFSAMTDVLAIDAAAELELHASAWLVFDISSRYSDEWRLRFAPPPRGDMVE